MRQVADLKPIPPPVVKPILPWVLSYRDASGCLAVRGDGPIPRPLSETLQFRGSLRTHG